MKKAAPSILIAVVLLAVGVIAWAQQPTKVPRIGFLQARLPPTPTNPDPLAEAFRQGLKDLGYIEGKNIAVEHRYSGGRSDRLPALVAELSATQGGCPRGPKFTGDPRSQAGDQDDSYCHRDYC
jgi:putative ABC transport system substrate-binding protein